LNESEICDFVETSAFYEDCIGSPKL